MSSSGFSKIAIAFTAGIGLALGGALLYVRAIQRPTAAPGSATVVVPDRLPDAGTPPAPAQAAEPAPTSAPPPASAPAPASVSAPAPTPAPAAKLVIASTPAPASKPVVVARKHVVQVAQNTPPPEPEPEPQSPTQPPQPQAQATAPAQPSTTVIVPPPMEAPPDAVASQPVPGTVAPEAPKREPRTVTIPVGTNLPIRLNDKLSTDYIKAGDSFSGTLQSSIILSNALIAERGSRVRGTVVNAQKGGHGEGVSDLALTLTEITTTDGQHVHVQTSSYEKHGGNATRDKAEKIGGGAVLGAIIGAIAGGGRGAAIGAGAGGAAGGGDVALTHGKPVVLESETPLNFALTQPVTITEKINH